MVLLVGAGLLIRSFVRLLTQDPGFDPKNVLTFQVSLPHAEYRQEQQQVAALQQIADRLSTIPGVVAAGGITWLPLDGLGSPPALPLTTARVPLPDKSRCVTSVGLRGTISKPCVFPCCAEGFSLPKIAPTTR